MPAVIPIPRLRHLEPVAVDFELNNPPHSWDDHEVRKCCGFREMNAVGDIGDKQTDAPAAADRSYRRGRAAFQRAAGKGQQSDQRSLEGASRQPNPWIQFR